MDRICSKKFLLSRDCSFVLKNINCVVLIMYGECLKINSFDKLITRLIQYFQKNKILNVKLFLCYCTAILFFNIKFLPST